jgi:hypothetical protein
VICIANLPVIASNLPVGPNGLFLKQGSESVLGGNFLDDLHDHDILINLRRVVSVRDQGVLSNAELNGLTAMPS